MWQGAVDTFIVDEVTQIGHMSFGGIAFAKKDSDQFRTGHARERNMISKESCHEDQNGYFENGAAT